MAWRCDGASGASGARESARVLPDMDGPASETASAEANAQHSLRGATDPSTDLSTDPSMHPITHPITHPIASCSTPPLTEH
eukprot:CAMPEP_0181202452 /NCGR_PEP_ID=MMETSP1096-20121128/18848_1 /TAXON_ID=156174 ORGANISM="Chrysochromulina ericina, Strain CCMP281" /NCGR_SAMPLE_ID=MMETSP1096 /ASSEMBLY_ACC=CAM_ASM_000453 /LENGTH=80 /DNA_ID=CAMNT_0023292963 /DNA_START=262 /DNA_END=505 /DNA_ORIENTATION=-